MGVVVGVLMEDERTEDVGRSDAVTVEGMTSVLKHALMCLFVGKRQDGCRSVSS